MNLNEEFYKMGGRYLALEDEKYFDMIKGFTTQSIMEGCYYFLCKDPEFPKIESLPQDKKLRIWNEAKAIKPEAKKEELIKISKALYLKSMI